MDVRSAPAHIRLDSFLVLAALLLHALIISAGLAFPADYPFGDYSDKLAGVKISAQELMGVENSQQLAGFRNITKYPLFYLLAALLSWVVPIPLAIIFAYFLLLAPVVYALLRERPYLLTALLLAPLSVTTSLWIGKLPIVLGAAYLGVAAYLYMRRNACWVFYAAPALFLHPMFLLLIALTVFVLILRNLRYGWHQDLRTYVPLLFILFLAAALYTFLGTSGNVERVLSRGVPVTLGKHVLYTLGLVLLGLGVGNEYRNGIFALAAAYVLALVLGCAHINPIFPGDMRLILYSLAFSVAAVDARWPRLRGWVVAFLIILAVGKDAWVLSQSSLLRGESATACIDSLSSNIPGGALVVTCAHQGSVWRYSFAPAAYLLYIRDDLRVVSITPELAPQNIMRWADAVCMSDEGNVFLLRVRDGACELIKNH